MMATDWSPAEDMRPGPRFQVVQPEKTARGDIYTFVVKFRSQQIEPGEADVPCYTQMTIRDCSGEYITTEGRIYSPPKPDTEDDA
jgi:hypothetical protein